MCSLVVGSALLRFGLAQTFTTPWIAPDEVIYGLVGESLWSDGSLAIRSLTTPYYSILTPALVGLPLAAAGAADGVVAAQALQSFAMSLVALPVYVWTQSLVGRRLGLVAACLSLLPAGLVYSGFLMTEPLAYTLTTVALLLLARTLEQPSLLRYGLLATALAAASAVRLQALVLLPVLAGALLVDAVVARRPIALRTALAVLAGVITTIGVAGLVLMTTGAQLGSASVLGAYAPAASGLALGPALSSVAWHALGLWLTTLGVPLLALLALGPSAARRGSDAGLRALWAVCATYAAALVVQVGVFASLHTGHVAGRYLLTALPVLVVVLCVWIGRGMPRALPVTLAAAALALLGVALVPLAQLGAREVLVDSPWLAPVGLLLDEHTTLARLALAGVVLAGTALVAAPGLLRARITVPMVVAAGFVALSGYATLEIARESKREQLRTVGAGAPAWIDALGVERASLLVTGDEPWTVAPRTLFWNRSLEEVIAVAEADPPFPPDPLRATVTTSGRVVLAGSGDTLSRTVVVAPSTLVLRGTRLGAHPESGAEAPQLVAWRVEGHVWVDLETDGFAPNGDLIRPARITIFGCVRGALAVTVLGKSGADVGVSVDGAPSPPLATPAGTATTHRIATPAGAEGTTACVVELVPRGLTGTTTIVFEPAPAVGGRRFRSG